jgi:RNA-binding protein Nova
VDSRSFHLNYTFNNSDCCDVVVGWYTSCLLMSLFAGDTEHMMHAFDMVFKMIVDDPQSGSCPNISYADFKGPIANANPTGSPFAAPAAGPAMHGFEMGNPFGFAPGGGCNMPFGGATHPTPSVIETLKTTLRGSGFSVQASEEITAAVFTLVNYGILNPANYGYPGFNMGPGQCGVSLDALMGLLAGGRPGYGGAGDAGKCVDKMGGGFGNGMDSLMGGYGMFGGAGIGNQNSFGIGVSGGMGTGGAGADDGPTISKDVQIGENIVGAVLGHGGRAIVEIQRMTSATIQISKKGVFAPGTRNRIATISGNPAAVERAIFMVNQCVQQEENKRVRQEHMMK